MVLILLSGKTNDKIILVKLEGEAAVKVAEYDLEHKV